MSDDSCKLLNIRGNDGTRQFAELPDRFGPHGWSTLRRRLAWKCGVKVTAFIDTVEQATIDFTYRGHKFTIDTQMGGLWLWVKDPDCPDAVLRDVIALVLKVSA